MKIMLYFFMLMAALSVQADAFKCKLPNGKIVYQSEMCAKNSVQQGVVKVRKQTPEEIEAAKSKLNAWQEQEATEDAAKADAERQRRAELQEQESLNLQRRSVIAQEQAAANTQQNRNYGAGLYGSRYGYGYGSRFGYPGYYPNMPNYPNYGGQYYQYPPPPQRRPGEYTGPPVHKPLPEPFNLQTSPMPGYYPPMR